MAIIIPNINRAPIFLVIVSVILLTSCNQQERILCVGINEGQYKGKALLFFHRPVSGSTYEVLLFPVCDKNISNDITTWQNNFEMKPGISFNLTSDDSLLREILNHSRLFPLAKREQLNKNFQSIYISSANIEIDGVENITRSVIGKNVDTVKSELNFNDRRDISLSYIYLSQTALKKLVINPN